MFPSARASSPSTWRWLLSLALPFLAFVLLEAAIFRTGLYAKWLEPNSVTGWYEHTLRAERRRHPGPNDILVVGDSRAAEGFSAKLATAASTAGRAYSNCAIAGATPRSWFYLLRAADPNANRYHAIVLPVVGYGDYYDDETLDDREIDLTQVICRLHYADLPAFASSFNDPAARLRVWRAGLLKGLVFQPDLLDLLHDPRKRVRSVREYRGHFQDWVDDYDGNSHNLAGLALDPQGNLILPAGQNEAQQASLRTLLRKQQPPRQPDRCTGYRKRWFGAIAAHYAHSATRLIVVRMPRGPLPELWKDRGTEPSVLRQMERQPAISLLDEHRFDELERPAFFFDGLHLNRAGRERFSVELARVLATY